MRVSTAVPHRLPPHTSLTGHLWLELQTSQSLVSSGPRIQPSFHVITAMFPQSTCWHVHIIARALQYY